MTRQHRSSIELFTGAGGLALGTAAAGFGHRLLLEYNKHACRTLRENQPVFGPACHLHEGDVREFDFREFSDIDLLAAGAPCQPFSIAGKHRTHHDERNLFPQVFRAVREARPKAVIIENVKGLLRPSLATFVEYVQLQLSFPEVIPEDAQDPDSWPHHLPKLRHVARQRGTVGLEYEVGRCLLNAADFGVPQVRERVFFVAVRRDLEIDWSPPRPSHSEAALQLAQLVTGTYWKRHGMRKRLRASHALLGRWMREAGHTEAWRTVRDALMGLPEPLSSPDPEWPNHLRQSGARSYPGHTGSKLDWPAKTLKAGVHGVPGGENMVRLPNGKVRYFSIREAARLQTFPDNYVFSGAWGEAMRQIGNAVPVTLALAVAQSVVDALDRAATADGERQRRLRPAAQQVEFPEFLIGSA